MKNLLLLIIIISPITVTTAQTKVYKGSSTYSSDVICNINNSKVYKKNSKN